MNPALRSRLVPEAKRRTLEELSDDLELHDRDSADKRSAFWTMLILSAVIASAGVLSDSTATVIGAMIIAPVTTPILGIAVAAVNRQRNGSVRFVVLGAAAVILIGALFSVVLPPSYDLGANSQIAGRVTPGLLDLVAALATGLAGSVALARRDVAAVLPGVAIAISLVPPLAVVGVCLGQGAFGLAFGALLLFTSNLVALVLAGMFVFTVLGYSSEMVADSERSARRTRVTFAFLLVAVLVPLALNTVLTYFITAWDAKVEETARAWVADVPGAKVEGVELNATTFEVSVKTPGALPPTHLLLEALNGKVPDGLRVKVLSTLGTTVDLGVIGQ
jgi:uncharacterized hydrophobic protein (TIGR00271 family)